MATFTLASLNICSAHFREGHYTEDNLSRLADRIKESQAHVVCLQEVDRGAERSCRVDMAAYLAEHTGLGHSYFIKIRDFQGGEYGTAIISRYPFLESKTMNYPVHIATQGTSCGYVTLDVEGKLVRVFNTHLSVENEESNTETLCCLGDILLSYRRMPEPLICCGDFNTSPKKVSRYIPWVKLAHDGLHTYADRSIDHILYHGELTASQTRLMDTQHDGVTDHHMVLTEISL